MIKFKGIWFLDQCSAMAITDFSVKFDDMLGVIQASAWNYGSLLL